MKPGKLKYDYADGFSEVMEECSKNKCLGVQELFVALNELTYIEEQSVRNTVMTRMEAIRSGYMVGSEDGSELHRSGGTERTWLQLMC